MKPTNTAVQARYNVYKPERKHGRSRGRRDLTSRDRLSGKRIKSNKEIEKSINISSGTGCVVE